MRPLQRFQFCLFCATLAAVPREVLSFFLNVCPSVWAHGPWCRLFVTSSVRDVFVPKTWHGHICRGLVPAFGCLTSRCF